MIAVLVLDIVEDREFAARAHVDLELADAVHDVVVHPFGVAAVRFAARLPVTFEDVPRIARKRRELRRSGAGGGNHRRREETDENPGSPGWQQTHGAPFTHRPSRSRAEYQKAAP